MKKIIFATGNANKMMTAGLQKIIDEKKAQLAAWQEANK